MLRIAKEALSLTTFSSFLLILPFCQILLTQHSADENYSSEYPYAFRSNGTVTEARLAIALAQEGGIGFTTKTCPLNARQKKFAV